MKNTIYIISLLYLISACNVLNVEPEDAIPADKAFKNKAGIERGILGSYSELQSLSYYGRSYYIFADLAADNLIHPIDATNTDYAEVDNNAILPENSAVSGIWASIYSSINTANNVIEKVPGMADMTDDEKNAALGELRFLRALNHFNLVNFFGPIPIKIKPTVGVKDLNAGRDPVDSVYSQIIRDLRFAEQNINPSNSAKTRATKTAASALLARVYLYKKDYESAYAKANEVLAADTSLLKNYADIFAGDASAESIFEIDFSEVDRNRIAENNFPKTLNGRREVAPSDSIMNAFEPNDKRKPASIAADTALIPHDSTTIPNFYADKYNDLSKGADNVIIIRRAELFLIRAEAEAHRATPDITAIQNDINKIRLRAGLSPTAVTSIEELLAVIEHERWVEFAFEGQRWFDLVRTGRAMQVLPAVTNINKTLFPIPLSEIQTNKSPDMKQNEGYY
jgi:starch-binding outer membrane protein, SusD/RagB family